MTRLTVAESEVSVCLAGPDEQLFELTYEELKRLASHYLAGERPGQTLQPTALVHEVYLRLFGATGGRTWASRRHFLATAAVAMRRILIEAARKKARGRHGGGRQRVAVDLDDLATPEVADELLALDEALAAFAAVDPTVAELVTLRYFGGLSLKEAAAVLDIPPRTADSYWAYARAWLQAWMDSAPDQSTAG